MNEIFAVLTQNILPIGLVASFGFALQRGLGLDKRSLSGAVFNVLSPCLVFASLLNSRLSGGELAGMGGFTIVFVAVMAVAGLLVGRLMQLSRSELAALLVLIMFSNSGNYGLTLVNLRYGEEGLARAVLYYVVATILLYTFGVFIASAGQLSWRATLARLARLPAVYAAAAALLFYAFRLAPPQPIMRGIEIAGAGAIPVMLLVLGMQLADLRGQLNFRFAAPAIGLRLVAAPILAVLIAGVLGLQGMARNAAIIEASMPPAIFTIILATEFGLQASAVTSVVVLATLLSPFTIALTIALLGL